MSFWKGRNLFKHIEIVPGGTFKGFGHVDPNGRVYYVNNITGASGAGGLSWNDAFDEVSSAITASEAYRQLGGLKPALTTNDYIRNTIVIQGTATPYASTTSFPNHCNVIGLGTNPYGANYGIVKIGANSGEGGGIYSAADCTGDYFWNIQFQSGANYSAIKVRNIFSTTFEDCAFFANGSPLAPPDCGFEITGNAGGLRLLNCHTGTNSGVNSEPRIGLKINGDQFINCLVADCTFGGTTAGIYVVSTMLIGWGSVIRDCYVGETSRECTIGIDDNANPGTIHYTNIMLNADDPIEVSDDGTRFVGCVSETAMVNT